MESALSKRLDAIEKKLDLVLKRTDPRASAGATADDVRRQLKEALSEDEEARPYAGLEAHLNQ